MTTRKEIIHQQGIASRLDRCMRAKYPGMQQSVIEKACRSGDIRLNGSKVKTNQLVEDGAVISLSNFFLTNIAPKYHPQVSKSDIKPGAAELAAKIFGEYRIFDHPHFLAINKPCGLAVQGGSKISLAIDDALKYISITKSIDMKVVHRLDKDTSGILLIAKTKAGAVKLANGFKERQIDKTYLAHISGGLPQKKSGTIKSYITKLEKDLIQEEKPSYEQAKLAVTNYKIIEEKVGINLVEFKPITGRMHQLRLHAKLLGYPIVGDKKYGGRKADRLRLHASSISFSSTMIDEKDTAGTIEISCDKPF